MARTVNAIRFDRSVFEQSENAKLDYTINWESELGSDTISTSTWTTEDTGITISDTASTTTTATCQLTGQPGRYHVINKIVTTAGLIDERVIELVITENNSVMASDYGFTGQ
jgi:hypothetical protein